MPINLEEIDKQIDLLQRSIADNTEALYNLKFIKEKLTSGTEDERKLITIISRITIDSVNAMVKDFQTIGLQKSKW